jgi:hypothetical protein
MPITPFLNGVRFDLETTRVMGVALEMVCAALRTGDRDDEVKRTIATKIIDLARAGERNPDVPVRRYCRTFARSGPPRFWDCNDLVRSMMQTGGPGQAADFPYDVLRPKKRPALGFDPARSK